MSQDALPPLRKAEAVKLRASRIDKIIENLLDEKKETFEEQDVELKLMPASLKKQQLLSSLNIQHWKPPHEYREILDFYYHECYATWKRWLLFEAGRMVTSSEYLTGFELRSMLAAYGESILDEWRKTCARIILYDVFEYLCDFCYIPAATYQKIIDAHQSSANSNKLNYAMLPQATSGEFGLGYIVRDRGGAEEEKAGILEFRCVTNDRTPGNMVHLITLKSIFSRQLPRMPREYITRLTFDRQHYCFCLMKNNRVIGGVCFRPFFQSRFAEIVFLAITSQEQVKGYGTRLMNHLKEYLRHRNFEYFLTYADNFALGYFRKQGFSTTITMHKDRWVGYIKDYDGGTLMECVINPQINYLQLSDLFIQQKKLVMKTLRMVSVPRIYNGEMLWKHYQPYTDEEFKARYPPNLLSSATIHVSDLPVHIDPNTIPGFSENGWSNYEKNTKTKTALPLNDQILKFLDQMSKHEAAWPFQKPVSKLEAPDYYEHVKHPMDISLMRKNAKNKVYKTKDEFGAHLKLMFDNCRFYNQEHSIYFKLATDLESAIAPAFEELIDD